MNSFYFIHLYKIEEIWLVIMAYHFNPSTQEAEQGRLFCVFEAILVYIVSSGLLDLCRDLVSKNKNNFH